MAIRLQTLATYFPGSREVGVEVIAKDMYDLDDNTLI